ncbi:MAG: hypothetical protein ACK4F7_08865 [Inhella sp.]
MDTFNHPKATRSQPERLPSNLAGELLFDRASVGSVECSEAGWDEWDTCVAEQDLRLAIAKLFH